VVAEFEDSALLETFAAGGLGVFPAPELEHAALVVRNRVRRVGPCTGVEEHFFAVGTEKRVGHVLVQQLLAGAG
jgi:LysR family transcriptional activator of nhaA